MNCSPKLGKTKGVDNGLGDGILLFKNKSPLTLNNNCFLVAYQSIGLKKNPGDILTGIRFKIAELSRLCHFERLHCSSLNNLDDIHAG